VGTTWLLINHNAATTDAGYLVVGTTPTDCTGAGIYYWSKFTVGAGISTDGGYSVSVPFRGVFTPATSGPVTFYLNGLMSFGQDGGDRFWYGSMTAHVN
jgi:hypothetical protein